MPPENILAIDLGGTQTRAALVTGEGAILARSARPTPTGDDDLDWLFKLASEVAAGDVSCAVVAVPGRVDYQRERLEHAPNLPTRWTPMLNANYLSDRLGYEVALANDADCAAVGETYFGGGRDHDDVVYMTVSTGIGAGVVLGGRLMRGRRSSAEIGHTIVDRRALFTGNPATIEELGSGSALEASAPAVGLPSDAREIKELVVGDDPEARRLWRDLLEVVMVGATNLAHLFSPEVIVVGGGIGRNAEGLLSALRTHLADHGPRSLPEPIGVVASELGDDAGLIGAAAWQRAMEPVSRQDLSGDDRRREIA